ncbi:hypothetical protein EC968_003560 [Mortierella alpina]|nr:hypothetical protein EC968_003560 [Mortierella alpina]
MIGPSLKDLILTLSLAILCTVAAPAANEVSLDACSSLEAKQEADVTYADVANCYKSIPFDSKIAASTMDSFMTVFNDYYIFRDSALTPNLQSPFTSPPVDIMKELKSIAEKKYAHDWEFYTAISDTLSSLNDGHVNYDDEKWLPLFVLDSTSHHPRYQNYQFRQPLHLYAPVVNGKQAILVYKDILNRGYEDCVVETIDGQDALTYLTQWKSENAYSKDAGVRLNQLLVTQFYDQEAGGIQIVAGDFAERLSLPDAPYIDYKLQCKSSAKPLALREKWKVVRVAEDTSFKDVKDCHANVCLGSTSKNRYDNQVLRPGFTKPYLAAKPRRPVPRLMQTPPIKDAVVKLNGADLIMEAPAVIFYHLVEHPKVGVLNVPAHSPSKNGLEDLVKGLTEFHKRNVTNVIIDLQGNSGGVVAYSDVLVQAFFPKKGEFDITFPMDLRSPSSTQKMAAAAYGKKWGGQYNAEDYVNYASKTRYTNADMFTHPVSLTRNGRTDLYSQLSAKAPYQMKSYPELETFPWTNKPGNIHILTDGRCGSACAGAAHIFSRIRKVSTTAVGGIQGKPLSKFTFAGGVVGYLSGIVGNNDEAKVNSTLKELPNDASLALPIAEVYAQDSTIPLEYDAAAYAADVHMDFDPKNARDRVVMWTQVAKQAWNL